MPLTSANDTPEFPQPNNVKSCIPMRLKMTRRRGGKAKENARRIPKIRM